MDDLELLKEIKKVRSEYGKLKGLDFIEEDMSNHKPVSFYLERIVGLKFNSFIGDNQKILTVDGSRYPYQLLLRSDIEMLISLLKKTLERYDALDISDNDIRFSKIEDIVEQHKDNLNQNNRVREKEKELIIDDLYLILDTIDNTLKIGRSKNISARLKQLQVATSHELNLLYEIKGKGFMEKELHSRFNDIRLTGEWFRNDGRIKKCFKEMLLC